METLNEWILKVHIIHFWDKFDSDLYKQIQIKKAEKCQK